MVKTAVIMAAGLGTRFGEYTETIPKGFVKCGDISMVERFVVLFCFGLFCGFCFFWFQSLCFLLFNFYFILKHSSFTMLC